jgi:cytoskeletal protein RodZ
MAEIGESLREARMRARIDISEVEARTKIRAKYLRALENEEWNLVPGPVYVKSFLKTYGDYLGLDSRLLIDEFKRRYERPSENEVRATASSARERERDRHRSRLAETLFSPIGVIVVALIVIVVALYLIGSHNGNGPSGSTGAITPSGGGGARHTKKHKTSTGHSTTSINHKKARSGVSTKSVTRTRSTVTTTSASDATLAMVPNGDTWVCVENASGTTLYTGTYHSGETIRTVHSSTLLVALGNNEVTITADGKPYTPSASSAIGLKITPKGVSNLATLPTC